MSYPSNFGQQNSSTNNIQQTKIDPVKNYVQRLFLSTLMGLIIGSLILMITVIFDKEQKFKPGLPFFLRGLYPPDHFNSNIKASVDYSELTEPISHSQNSVKNEDALFGDIHFRSAMFY